MAYQTVHDAFEILLDVVHRPFGVQDRMDNEVRGTAIINTRPPLVAGRCSSIVLVCPTMWIMSSSMKQHVLRLDHCASRRLTYDMRQISAEAHRSCGGKVRGARVATIGQHMARKRPGVPSRSRAAM
jgi:hypothetical protein